MRRLAVALVVLSAAAPVYAAEFIPGWDAHTAWDSNLLKTVTDTESDFSLRTGPDLRVLEEQGDLQYDFTYRLRYDAYARINGINAFDQTANGDLSWRVGPLTDLTVSDDFGYITDLNGIFVSSPTAAIGIVVPGRERLTYNNGSATMTHRLSPLWQVEAQLSNEFYDYANSLQNDSLSNGLSLQTTRSLSQRTLAGFGASYTDQSFSDVVGQPASSTTFIQGYGILIHSFSPSFKISAQAGPAYTIPETTNASTIESPTYFAIDPTTCPNQLPNGDAVVSASQRCLGASFRTFTGQFAGNVAPSTSTVNIPFTQTSTAQDSVNYFGSLSVEKFWREWNGRLAYSRQASGASGLGTSTTLDSFTGNLRWAPSPVWEVSLLASYATQSAASEQPETEFTITPVVVLNPERTAFATIGVPVSAATGRKTTSAFEVTTFRTELRAFRRFGRHLTVDGGVIWWQQETSGDQVQATKRDAFQVDIGVVWTFEPIPL